MQFYIKNKFTFFARKSLIATQIFVRISKGQVVEGLI